MKKSFITLVLAAGCLLLVHSGSGKTSAQVKLPAANAPQSLSVPRVDADFGKMPLYFIPNYGQMDKQVAYYVQGKDKTLYFTPEGVTLALASPVASEEFPFKTDRRMPSRDLSVERGTTRPPALQPGNTDAATTGQTGPGRWIVKLDFVDADKNVRPVGQEETGAAISYFRGKPEEWRAGLPTYSKIVYPDLWPGIDLAYYGTVNKLKYEFIVHPGADPSKIRLAYRGAESVSVEPDGRLKVTTQAGSFSDDVPVAYQEKGGKRLNIGLAYELRGAKSPRTAEGAAIGDSTARDGAAAPAAKPALGYGFKIEDYDAGLPLVLDPAIMVYCGYVGGSGYDTGFGIAVDEAGNAYLTGYASSNDATFPVTVGPDLTSNGSSDAFVAKVNAAGTALVYCGYIGGSSSESGYGHRRG